MKAHMSNATGAWHLYVVLIPGSRWPAHRWPCGSPIPTPAQRAGVLAELGYQVVPGAGWNWREFSSVLDEPASPVDLLASAEVLPVTLPEGVAA